ncbi:MAG: zinc-dependent alcohol dehydrogenase family protein [Bifidobacteriaceae bacterium]|jgi:alcohol dehydrogenase|nr:zinc-dependent alcohol dehydrogenase family protein [Bifidobacteriaceae bacterium]
MKALVYHGPGQKAWETVPDPTIQDPNDVIVKIDTTTICGSDLHILKGDVPTVDDGRVLGHEGVGTVVETGSGVAKFEIGHRVVVNCITTCGTCAYCRVGHPSHCQSAGGVGWLLGHLVDGTQAEYVRIPFGETSLHSIPGGLSDEEVIFVSDIIPTGYEMGVLNGHVQPGDDVVVIGAGPVGLAAMVTAQLKSPRRVIAVDLDDFRLEAARRSFGATHTVNSGHDGWMDEVRALTRHGGAYVVMEAVGVPVTLEAAFDLVRPTGRIANIGVHGAPVTMPIDRLWIENITMTMGLVDAVTAPMLIELIEAGKLNVRPLATHHFKLDQMLDAYDVFGQAAKNEALKVVIQA